jgi:AcrR family transcriptional regulator
MRQASMYYYFDSKEALLQSLLETTVAPSLDFARWAVGEGGSSPEARLWALARIDAAGLAGSGRNLGALYLLPEVRRPAFAPFRELRERLRGSYRELLALTTGGRRFEPAEADLRSRLVFGLVESVILARQDDAAVSDPVDFSMRVADGALRLAETADLAAVRDEGRRLCSSWMERSARDRADAAVSPA